MNDEYKEHEMTDETKLKPCPFCGGKAERWEHDEDIIKTGCKKCFYVYPYLETDVDEAAEMWNTRPIEDALRAALEEIRDLAQRNVPDSWGGITDDEWVFAKCNRVAVIAAKTLEAEK